MLLGHVGALFVALEDSSEAPDERARLARALLEYIQRLIETWVVEPKAQADCWRLLLMGLEFASSYAHHAAMRGLLDESIRTIFDTHFAVDAFNTPSSAQVSLHEI